MANKREEQLKEITERLEQGVQELFTSERYREYLNTMAKFHNYSFNNTLLITMQRPDATLVAGYQAWQKKFNRHVLRGEKGIQIISPAPIREKEEVEKINPETNEPILKANGQPETEIIEHVIPRFKVATVFDVSQTEGEPLPDLGGADLTGQVADFTVFMEAIRNVSPVPIRFAEIEGTSHGYYHNTDKEIVIKSGMSESQTMKTAIHEVTHALLHDRDLMEEQGIEKDKMTKEVEAESVAYIVCQHFGLDSSEYSFPYIAGWSSDRDMKELRTSMDLIRKTAGDFIENMTEQLHILQKEHSLEKTFSEQETSGLSFEEYQRVELFDVPALFVNERVDLETLPEGIYRYELRGADYDPGYPLTIEKNVTVNHAATILTVVPLNIPEQGYLRIGEELNMTGGMQSIPEYQSEISEHDLTVERKKTENAIGRANESLYLSGTDNRYAIYQIAGNTKGREYAFMGMDFVTSHGMTVQGADYAYIYGGLLSENDTLDSLYQTFNINHPENYTGHSLSVSDVVVVQRNGEAKAYYVDSFGFKELPDFVQQRIQEAEMNRKREDSMITLDTTGVEIEQHEGLWHTVDKMEIENEIFYLMRHNEYGDSVAAVILNADGELVAQDLENGFDQGAMEAIREFFKEKGIDWHPKQENIADGQTSFSPLYIHSLTYAMEHGEADAYLDSRKLNIECKGAIEETIRQNFDGMHLNRNAADSVLEKYGLERCSFILACTIQEKSWDGRFSGKNKEWAETVFVPENINRGVNANLDYVVESHPAILDGFTDLVREKIAELEKIEVFIRRYYVVSDIEGTETGQQYRYFVDIEEAIQAYHQLPGHLNKYLGIESTEKSPMRRNLLSCENGIDEVEYIGFNPPSEKWMNPEMEEATEKVQIYLQTCDKDAAYWLENERKYLYVQTVSDGYDYTFYDEEYKELDGGLYSDSELTFKSALQEIMLDEFRSSIDECKVINSEEFLEKAEEIAEKKLLEQVENMEHTKQEKNITADTVTNLRGKSREYDSSSRESIYTFECSINGNPGVLTYTIGKREYFYSPLSDRGKMEDIYSIHTDGDDIWDQMSEAELSKLEIRLAGEAEVFDFQEKSKQAVSVYDLKEISFELMEREKSSMTKEQRERVWDGLSEKGNELLAVAIAGADNRVKLQFAQNLLIEAQGILKESQYDNWKYVINKREIEMPAISKPPLISEKTEPEKAFAGKSCAEIEETVLCLAQAQLEEMGLENEVVLLGARVYGSRTREGLYTDHSDLDVVLSYDGNIREDTFFNCLNEVGMSVAGLKLDINPISEEKTGTLEDYLKIAEKYLDDKEVEKLAADIDQFSYDYDQYEYDDSVTDRDKNVRSIYTALTTGKADGIREWLAEIAADENDDLPENVKDAKKLIERMDQVQENSSVEINHEMKKTEATISFYAAECMEFPVLGEYHENLTLEEALAVYEKIPAERMNGIKGIGFVLHDGSAYDNAEYELMSAGQIRTDMIELIPHYKESLLVQKAVTDVKTYLENQTTKETDKNLSKNKERQTVIEKNEVDRQEIPQQRNNSRKESVLQALRERQAKLKAQEQAKHNEKSHTKKKGEQEL